MKNEILPNPDGYYLAESYSQVLQRYTGFGNSLYSLLENELPEIFQQLVFYREDSNDITHQDSYAIYENETHPFGIQLDPDIEVIVIWTHDDHIEIGYWWEDPCAEALRFIKDVILGK